MAGEEPVNPHVFNVEPYGRLRRYRWRCACDASGGGFITRRTSAVLYGDNHAMQSNQ